MAQLRHAYEEFVKRDTEIIVVGPDLPQMFQAYWAREKLPFVGLADPHHTVADRYGQEVKILKWGRMPALMILDRQGRVRMAHYADSMKDYPPLKAMYAILDGLRDEQDKERGQVA